MKQNNGLVKKLFEDKPRYWMKALRKRWEDWQSSRKVRRNLDHGASAECRSAVNEVLTDSTYRGNARKPQKASAKANGLSVAADLIEKSLGVTKKAGAFQV